MKKRLMPTALAFLTLIVLLVYANYFETSEILEPGAQKPELILGCQASEITSIAWKLGGEIQYKLVIASDSCHIMAPQKMAATAMRLKASPGTLPNSDTNWSLPKTRQIQLVME